MLWIDKVGEFITKYVPPDQCIWFFSGFMLLIMSYAIYNKFKDPPRQY